MKHISEFLPIKENNAFIIDTQKRSIKEYGTVTILLNRKKEPCKVTYCKDSTTLDTGWEWDCNTNEYTDEELEQVYEIMGEFLSEFNQ